MLNKSETRRVFVSHDLSCSVCDEYASVVNLRFQARIFLKACSGISHVILNQHGTDESPSVTSSMGICLNARAQTPCFAQLGQNCSLNCQTGVYTPAVLLVTNRIGTTLGPMAPQLQETQHAKIVIG